MKKKLVVLSGAGISAESGIKTFRDTGGLWENHSIEEVATPEGWRKNPQLVLDFYNARRAQAAEAQPNAGHITLANLEAYFDVHIITQNVDSLHEKGGSSKVLHLHGELSKVRSVKNDKLIYDIGGKAIQLGDLAEDGGQLRPHIVWFGEMVPMIEPAAELCMEADIFIVVGTSLQVYPAAGLIGYVDESAPKFIIDPNKPDVSALYQNINFINETAAIGLPKLAQKLIEEYQ
ncbi:NAD-dependent deacetylase [Emticicia oligotrophica DSM 17448]|uniref:NAD-dependent protein deacylase n=1 Tax=Emticicia oligotrophica (strain DSM 17448 / CIP 109782 / MTCC 6937 / GPTSA100-15) TaxID=929562 RepID=A0ABM5N6Q6_EMTOG|nr:Sir2 family NAD-dependent protein deacetylase [Emticicia oligotrophica]AFK05187.1 NAD-dependent deacetylase [Emticicia oligotrophica DSM 17448]